jgi:hypothetical protein
MVVKESFGWQSLRPTPCALCLKPWLTFVGKKILTLRSARKIFYQATGNGQDESLTPELVWT